MHKKMGFCSMILFLGASLCFAQGGSQPEEISITTYYPSPYGSYGELRSKKMALGDNYISGSNFCWPPDTCTIPIDSNADLVVQGNVGIGTVSPSAELEVAGQIKITGGLPGANKVLTSNAAGLASWVNPNKGFTTGSYVGNGTINRAIAHGLGTTPHMVIIMQQNGVEVGFVTGIYNVIPGVGGGLVTAWDATYFYVRFQGGGSYGFNDWGQTYNWIAFSQ